MKNLFVIRSEQTLLFPPKNSEQSHRFGWMQQGDINVNVRGTLTAFNPDLSHTSLSKMFLLKTAFCYIVALNISCRSLHSRFSGPQREYFSQTRSARKLCYKSNEIMYADLRIVEAGGDERWRERSSFPCFNVLVLNIYSQARSSSSVTHTALSLKKLIRRWW